MKRIICLILTVVMSLVFVSCGKKEETKKEKTTAATTQTTTAAKILNPLTGESGFDSSKVGKRPVAVMINNISVAQRVQTGVGEADMVWQKAVFLDLWRFIRIFQRLTR